LTYEKEAKRRLYVWRGVRCRQVPQAQRHKSLFCFFFLQKKEDSSLRELLQLSPLPFAAQNDVLKSS
jgi:hypothetical protein